VGRTIANWLRQDSEFEGYLQKEAGGRRRQTRHESSRLVAMTRKVYRVGRARTGFGLFATSCIEKGASIIEYRGRRIASAQAKRMEAGGNRYMFEINNRFTLDGSSRRNVARYANHSCRPNAESDVVRGKVILRAIKRIRPGEEITYDYGREYFDLFLRDPGCKCPKCLGRRKKQQAA
jgi:uncharacterized protein